MANEYATLTELKAARRIAASDTADDTALTALRLSLVTSLCSAALSVVFGVPLAWLLARSPGTAAHGLELARRATAADPDRAATRMRAVMATRGVAA